MDGQVPIQEQLIPCADGTQGGKWEHVLQVDDFEGVGCNVVLVGEPCVGQLSMGDTRDKRDLRRSLHKRIAVPDCTAAIFMVALTVGFLGICTQSCVAFALMTGGLYDHDDVVLHIDSSASKHFISDISLLTSWDPETQNVTFNTTAGTTITSRAVGTVKFKECDEKRK